MVGVWIMQWLTLNALQVPQLPAVVEQNTPEELSPLVEALERARQQLEEATGVREALEAEVGAG